jgi:AcrR family transcriptional regulator
MSMATTSEILSKTIDLFKNHGINQFSMQDIADEIGVSMEQLTETADSKEELLRLAMLHDIEEDQKTEKKIIEDARNAIEEIMGLLTNGIRNTMSLNPKYLADVLGMPFIWQMIAEEIENYSMPLYKEILNRGIRQGIFRTDINIEIVTKIIMENIKVLYNFELFPPDRFSSAEVARSIYLYYFRGLCRHEQAYLVDNYFAMNIHK